MQAINLAAFRNECDDLLVARGGGSIEDLWAFNDEQLAYAICACPIPVIAGIGHESDFTIADFVADLRAPTPTAAAEMAVSASSDLMQQIESVAAKLRRTFRRQLDQLDQTLDRFARCLVSPIAAIRHDRLKLAGMQAKRHGFLTSTQQAHFRFEQLKQRLLQNMPNTVHQRNRLCQLTQLLQRTARRQLASQQQALVNLHGHFEMLNPQRTLERGYAMVLDKKGNILRKPDQFKAPENITVRLAEGEVDLGVVSVQQHFGIKVN